MDSLPEAAWCSEESYMWNINMSHFLHVIREMVAIVVALPSLKNHAFWRDVYINQPTTCLLCFFTWRG
ncbi:hypothetical protein VNO78_23294 [Psophocarpus tetragonolobus]|uniref:Uncharacterized protein n=1 Tax=Psophocarpus tetragonolobus TaxID=3891 RepID=A0AAN9S3A2_PSOTE